MPADQRLHFTVSEAPVSESCTGDLALGESGPQGTTVGALRAWGKSGGAGTWGLGETGSPVGMHESTSVREIGDSGGESGPAKGSSSTGAVCKRNDISP